MLPSGVFRSAFPRWRPRGYLGHGSESGLFHILAVPLFIFTNAIILSAVCTFSIAGAGDVACYF